MMPAPRATYRVQLQPAFDFAAARGLVRNLACLIKSSVGYEAEDVSGQHPGSQRLGHLWQSERDPAGVDA